MALEFSDGTKIKRRIKRTSNGYYSYNYLNERLCKQSDIVDHLLSDLGTIASIDPKRIYATGISNGALLSYRLACEMSDTFAAIAPVVGMLLYSPCQPQQQVSVMHVHGVDDTIAPYAGGKSSEPKVDMILPSVEQGIATWVQLDDCTGSAQEEKQDQFTHIAYDSCQAGTAVELYTLNGFGHDWPQPYLWPVPNSKTIWDFFAAHPKP